MEKLNKVRRLVDRFLLLLIFIVCIGPSLIAQDNSIDKKVNNLVESMQPKPVVEKKQDTVKIYPSDSLYEKYKSLVDEKIISPDLNPDSSWEAILAYMANKIVDTGQYQSSIDTGMFVQRNETVKNRRPKKNFKTEKEWRTYDGLKQFKGYKVEHELDSTKVVFGWHPYWMGDAYKQYNFSLLTHVAYFGYKLNPATGGYQSIHEWRETALVDSAHAHGAKALLSVNCFGFSELRTFLNSIPAQKNFIKQFISVLKEKDGDGVNLDFEMVPSDQRNNLTNFIIDLATSLEKENKDYIVTVALPAFDFRHVWEIKKLEPFVDVFTIMGYEFYGQNSTVAGPTAPLESGEKWWAYNLQRSVDDYLATGVDQTKIVLGLPYYGVEWQTEDLQFPSRVKRFIKYKTYAQIRKLSNNTGCCLDETSKSKYFVYRNDNNEYRQVWYEDTASLALKYDWINQKEIGGVGIWALGYDHGYTDLWKLLAKKFSRKDQIKLVEKNGSFSFRRLMMWLRRGAMYMSNPSRMLTNPRPIMMLFGGIFGFSVLGFMLFWRFGSRFGGVFKMLFKSTLAFFIVLFIVLIILLVYLFGAGSSSANLDSDSLKYVYFSLGGFLVGTIIVLILSRRFLSEKELP